MRNQITEVTRRNILDWLSTSRFYWAGRLNDVDFLSRLYDLTQMRSTDYRMRNAEGDIQQHAVDWNDWEPDWVFTDSRFNLLRCDDDEFLNFLCETIHPVVREDEDDAETMLDQYNEYLAKDGYTLRPASEISGRLVFQGQQIGLQATVFDEPTGWIKLDRQMQEIRHRLNIAENEEQFQAVGLLCREALITVAQEIYDQNMHPTSDGVIPSGTDAQRMLDAYLMATASGQHREEVRRHAKAALRLALALQHSRTADFRMAAICAEATTSVVNLIAIFEGRRDRSL